MSDKVDPLSEFTIRLPTEEQHILALKSGFVPWGRGMTFEQFVEMDKMAAAESWHQDGAERVWVLVRKDDLEGDIYSSCGTFRRKAWLKQPGSDKIEETFTYGIQSVVTPVQHHKNGYARHLIKLLHYYLASPTTLPGFPSAWGSPPKPLDDEVRKTIPYATAAFLWSDVDDFYSKCTIGDSLPGYLLEDDKNRALIWKALPTSSSSSSADGNGWEWIYEEDMDEITKELEDSYKSEFITTSSDKVCIQTNPGNVGTLPFLPLRAWAEGGVFTPESREKHPFGLKKKNSKGKETIVIITPGLGAIYKRLSITIHLNLLPEDVPSLLEKMDELAPARETKEGQIWGLDPAGELAQAFKKLKDREVDQYVREGKSAHLLAVASYLPKGEKVDLRDSQIWNWC